MKKHYIAPQGSICVFCREDIMSGSAEYVDKGTQNYSLNWEAKPYDGSGY